ncbi:MAG: outer membrane beta-barrel protein [Cyclobacteriaceae bacterium]
MNKSFFLLFASLIVTTSINAQTSSGNMMVGGSIDFSSVARESGSVNDVSSVTFSPSFGYFIIDNFAVGVSLTLGSTRTGTGAGKTVSSSFALGPFARYYLFTSNDRFAFFGQAGLNFGSGKTDPAAGGVTKNSFISFAVSPGAAFFFNEHWGLEFSITGFQISSSDPDTATDNDKVTRVDFDLRSLSPTLGFRYHF